jgi:hypothetical protein
MRREAASEANKMRMLSFVYLVVFLTMVDALAQTGQLAPIPMPLPFPPGSSVFQGTISALELKHAESAD